MNSLIFVAQEFPKTIYTVFKWKITGSEKTARVEKYTDSARRNSI